MNGRRDGKEGMERRREWDEQKRNIEGMQNNGWFNSKEGGGSKQKEKKKETVGIIINRNWGKRKLDKP